VPDEIAPSDSLEGGEVAAPAVDQAHEASTSTEPSFDWSQYADQTVEVKVDGETLRVPLSEALNGYSRQADYTQKTQALAAQREQLEYAEAVINALQTDPEGTLEYLKSQLVQEQAPEPQFQTEAEKTLYELQQWKTQQDELASVARVEKELDSVQQKYGLSDEERLAVLQHAAENALPSLELAYKDMSFPTLLSASQEKAAVEAADTERDTEAQEAKRGAFSPEGGRSPARGSIQNFAAGELPSFRDAYEKAKQVVG
jgi:hypothetical protein